MIDKFRVTVWEKIPTITSLESQSAILWTAYSTPCKTQ